MCGLYDGELCWICSYDLSCSFGGEKLLLWRSCGGSGVVEVCGWMCPVTHAAAAGTYYVYVHRFLDHYIAMRRPCNAITTSSSAKPASSISKQTACFSCRINLNQPFGLLLKPKTENKRPARPLETGGCGGERSYKKSGRRKALVTRLIDRMNWLFFPLCSQTS